MTLSITAKESIKTALAMTIAYGIALAMDWGTPMWAGFSVAFVSLSTSGQSFNKSAMRLLGTVVAGIASLILIALFPQDRWLFILALSLYVGFCTYMMGAAKYQYFWFVCGYVCIIVALEAGPNPVSAFHLATLRVQETGLGILVYSVVTALLWHKSSADDFNTLVIQLNSTQQQLYRHYFNLLNGRGHLADAQDLIIQSHQQQLQFKALLDAVETDSYEVSQQHWLWQSYQNQMLELSTTLESWHSDFLTMPPLDNSRFLLNLKAFDQELEQRFVQIQQMLKGHAPKYQAQSIQLELDKNALKSLSHFQQAALLAMQTNLLKLEQVTQVLHQNIADIKGFNQKNRVPTPKNQPPKTAFTFDIERLASIVQVMATLWLSFLAFIYITDLPGSIFFVVVTGVIGMALAANPNLPVSSMFMPFANSTLFCSIIYAIIMPQLSSFFGLGIMIFIVTFVICYVYSAPQQSMGRAAGLSVFVTMISIDNQQSYHILSVFNTALVFVEMFIILVITSYIPFSSRPDKAFTRLLKRFFRSSEYLIADLSSKQQTPLSFWEKQRKAFHRQELKTLPNKIKKRSQLINTRVFTSASKIQIQATCDHLQLLNIRLQALLEADAKPQATLLLKALSVDSQNWSECLLQALQCLEAHLVIDNLKSQLNAITADMEAQIQNEIESSPLSDRDRENFYHLLGAYHGVSSALLNYSENAQGINWVEWQEAKF
ncbi:MAG: hypothetical protein GQ582_12405 [Methyloprofundus sp.]|nr:hypothetical protein [Methyloprofundus sp.]